MVPLLYGSVVDDTHTFVKTLTGWHTLDALDDALLARLHALDATCASYVERATPASECIQIAWVVADAGLRNEMQRFERACGLARVQCMR